MGSPLFMVKPLRDQTRKNSTKFAQGKEHTTLKSLILKSFKTLFSHFERIIAKHTSYKK